MTKPTGKGRGGPRTAGPGKRMGRPRVDKQHFTVMLYDEEPEQLRERAGERGTTIQHAIREAIRAAGLIGAATGEKKK